MTKEPEKKYYCGDCKKELTAEDQGKPCPACGSIKRHIELFVYERSKGRVSLKVRAKNKARKTTRITYVRNKLSKKGNEAKEELIIDKVRKRKTHHVQEQDRDGTWKTVHNEKDVPLKNRRNKVHDK
jgi:DNA-directed RNA polymerase subunit RPC12/RpoP